MKKTNSEYRLNVEDMGLGDLDPLRHKKSNNCGDSYENIDLKDKWRANGGNSNSPPRKAQ